ncbi:hypothetical protein HMJ29_05410 [Hymenobacter taeanensis]|uniref:DUF922 domain-containing protein n=1 Tax=Hymenobacter taeanensis TaxID=2735321 RepID=A0A6M6BEN0_9BACT|nr:MULTISPECIES: hypothetical protein [Hymenobacter]QJX46402.1 hypothetical protein HMJ29_05410 [Hymenobacter taeanensis]UOQ80263.1 hypothetical protein MUN83_15725 [Hymenobacter sp. 5414T-23]
MPVFSVKRPVMRRWGWWLVLPVVVLLAAAVPANLRETPLVLQPAKLPFTPTQFYVAQVRDERPNRTAVAWLVPAPAKPGAPLPTAQPVDLQGGGLAAIQAFVRQSLPRNPALRPIQIRLRECRVQEKAAANGTVEGQISLDLAFDYQTPDRLVPLTQYRGGARYVRPAANRSPVEPALRQALANSLVYLNTWLNQAAASDVRLATAVHPTFRYVTRRTEADTVFHDPAHPLTWADFTGQPRPRGQYAASVFPGFAYQGRPRVRNGVVELDILLSIFVVRSSSWVALGQQTALNLNHEQRHFDLVRIVAERFRRKATPDSLTVEDYNSILQLQYLKSFTEMNHLQDQYDTETHGGTDLPAQERWNQRIDADLKKYGVR